MTAGTSTGYVDLHSHVLAGVDDGPTSGAQALELVTAMARTGVATVVATSHVSAAHPNGAEDLADAHRGLVVDLEAAGVTVAVLRGAEVEMGMAMTLSDDELRGLRIEGTRWLLLETPHTRYPAGLPEVVGRLRSSGCEVLIAHPERNEHLQQDPRILRDAAAAGALGQVTGASIRGVLGRGAQQAAWRFLEQGLAHVVSSDAHDTRSRPPDMDRAAAELGRRYGAEAADRLTRVVPGAILADATAHEARSLVGELSPRRSWWRKARA